VLDRLGLPGTGDDEQQQSRRAALLDLVGVWGGAPHVQKQARELAVAYIKEPSALPGTLVGAVLRVAAYGGDAVLYDQYVNRLKQVRSNPEEYYRFFAALPYFRDPALMKRTLAFALSPEVRTQDSGTLIAGVLAVPWGRDVAWTFVKQQWTALTARLGTFQGIPTIVQATSSFCSTKAAADVKTFFAKHPVESAERSVRQSIERIDSCAALDARQSQPLSQWLGGTL
jgi:puromycin-sensitive aminopeptidase